MSLTGQNITKIPDTHHPQELCEVCAGKDDEDLYIVFNALYRIIIGEVFQGASDKLMEENEQNSSSLKASQQKQQDFQTSQEKLHIFRQSATRQSLIDIISSPRFDLLLREIFKSKYSRVQDTSCKHQELAMKFIRNFNLKNDDNSEINKKRSFENVEKLDILYNKVKQLKTEIESYHSEIDELPNRIVKKLLPNHPHIAAKKSQITNEEEENSDDQSSDDIFDPFTTKKTVTNNTESGQSGASTAQSSESGSNSGSNSGHYDKNAEANQADKQGQKPKKSKAATFKSKLPKKATDILKNWFLNNIQNPYPSHEAKETLSKMTSLTRKQIQNWFTNSRKRFLEPLKKKIEAQKQNNKDGILSTEAMQAIFSPDSQSQTEQVEPTTNIPQIQEVPILKQPQLIPQIQPIIRTAQPIPFVQAAMPTNIADDSLQKSIGIQKLPTQVSPQVQPIIYSGALAPTNVNPGSNFVVVPWVMTQPVLSYRPPTYSNVFPINNPQFVSFPQNNYLQPSLPIVDNIPFMNNSYVFSSPQPNVIDMNGIMKQQQQFPQYTQQSPVPSSYNTINNNVFNNVGQQGQASQPIYVSQDRQSLVGRMPQYGIQQTTLPDGFQKANPSAFHQRPDMGESGLQGAKFINKNPFPESNLN